MNKILNICLILILLVPGCSKKNSQRSQDADLLNSTWVLSYIQSTSTNVIMTYPADAPKKISIVFTRSDNKVSFSGVCNSGSGTFSFLQNTGGISIQSITTTKIGCQYVEWEAFTTQNLDNATSFRIDGNNLVIYSGGDYNLYFTKK